METQSFKPSNELTFITVQPDMNRLLKLLQDNNATAICLDLNQVTQCDSAGLALLIEAKRLCKKYNKILEIAGASKEIQALAEFCGVQTMLTKNSEATHDQ